MSGTNKFKEVQVGNETFELPIDGRGNWGESATAILEALAEASQLVQGPNDVLLTSANLLNNQEIPVNLGNLAFNTGQVLGVTIEYFIKRTFDDGGPQTFTENGLVYANYNGTDWRLTQEANGDSGINFTITPSGQVQYTSTDLVGHISSIARFRARTIDDA